VAIASIAITNVTSLFLESRREDRCVRDIVAISFPLRYISPLATATTIAANVTPGTGKVNRLAASLLAAIRTVADVASLLPAGSFPARTNR